MHKQNKNLLFELFATQKKTRNEIKKIVMYIDTF
jgi:hypothetical protein